MGWFKKVEDDGTQDSVGGGYAGHVYPAGGEPGQVRQQGYGRARHAVGLKPWAAGSGVLGFLFNLFFNLVLVAVGLAIIVALYSMGDQISTEDVGKFLMTPPVLIGLLLITWVPLVLWCFFITRGRGQNSFKKDFGFYLKADDLLPGVLLGAGMFAFTMLITGLLKMAGVDTAAGSNTDMVTKQTGITLVAFTLGASIGAPVFEELFFRGFLLRSFIRTLAKVDLAEDPRWVDRYKHVPEGSAKQKIVWALTNPGVIVSLLAAAVLFGGLHAPSISTVEGFVQLITQVSLLGVVLGVASIVRRSLGVPIIAHLVYNSSALILTFIS